jgi:hypothetical protein
MSCNKFTPSEEGCAWGGLGVSLHNRSKIARASARVTSAACHVRVSRVRRRKRSRDTYVPSACRRGVVGHSRSARQRSRGGGAVPLTLETDHTVLCWDVRGRRRPSSSLTLAHARWHPDAGTVGSASHTRDTPPSEKISSGRKREIGGEARVAVA